MSEYPIIGVVNATHGVFDECLYGSGIDLSWEEYARENEGDEEALEMYECDEPEYIIGDWEWSETREQYRVKHNVNGCGYAAVVGYLGGAPIVHVLWSETTRRVHSMCSPCCPNQADLDSGNGNILAYDLPKDLYWDGE